ncbi:hypothetical protein J6590_083442 [Homalodisca vitripennis]|nr:hypothetical protein J6590_083442 [Homalodisca vitripennis]
MRLIRMINDERRCKKIINLIRRRSITLQQNNVYFSRAKSERILRRPGKKGEPLCVNNKLGDGVYMLEETPPIKDHVNDLKEVKKIFHSVNNMDGQEEDGEPDANLFGTISEVMLTIYRLQ